MRKSPLAKRRVPSVKTLTKAFGHFLDKEVIRFIRKVLKGEINIYDFEVVQDLVRVCYHEPSYDHKLMTLLNVLLNGYGIEAIRQKSGYWDRYYGNVRYEYVNMGDSYTATIIHDTKTGRYFVSSWGDLVERNPKLI